MAGSYNHIVTDAGNLGSNEFVVSTLDTGGDVFETVEEMYGMIWYLARGWALPVPSDDAARIAWCENLKQIVKQAQTNYKEGLDLAKSVHELSPDQRRE